MVNTPQQINEGKKNTQLIAGYILCIYTIS